MMDEGGGEPSANDSGSSHRRSAMSIGPAQGSSAALDRPQHRACTVTLSSKLWDLLFHAHLAAVAAVIIFSVIYASDTSNRKFHPKLWYIPLLTSAVFSVVAAAMWLAATLRRPLRALKTSLWLAPLLTCANVVLLLLDTESSTALALAFVALSAAIVMSLYACWVTPRLIYAGEILTDSLSFLGTTSSYIRMVIVTLAAGLLFTSFWVIGISSVAAHPPKLAEVYVLALPLSLAWTTHVIRNALFVAISRPTYFNLTAGPNPNEQDQSTFSRYFGTLCLGSALIPLVVVLRGTARAKKIVTGGVDEFLFSCTGCCMAIADRLVASANRWALVHIGHGRGLVEASEHTWGAFERAGMVRLVDSDLTSSMCFLCGVANGAACALACGVWALVVDKEHTTCLVVYAFLVGYFMVRIAMAWPQGCISAYLVAYAEDPQNICFDHMIPNRIRQLQSA